MEKGDHHRNVGMALNVNLKIEGMVEIEKSSDESNQIVAYVKPVFSEVETDEISRLAAELTLREFFAVRGFPLQSEERAKVEPTLTKLYRSKSTIKGRHIYYFQVEKHYKKPAGARDSSCYEVSFLAGWVTKDKEGTLALLNESFGLTDCDLKERGSSVELFNVMTSNERVVVQSGETSARLS